MLTLGIESSCDDTSVAVVEDGVKIHANIVSSQIEIHRRFGGVVPEVASRKHLEAFLPLLEEAMQESGKKLSQIGQIAVTAGPGLLGSLLVGLSSAKALAWTLNIPLIPVNHLEAHLFSAFLAKEQEPSFPFLGMIVSGGHSSLVMANGPRSFQLLGYTLDDAPGELFDKTARFLGLGYPGGPEIQKIGQTGNPTRYALPRPMIGQGLNFSFSGLKTAVLSLAKKEGKNLTLPDLCASLQTAVAETICSKIKDAFKVKQAQKLVVAGGVAANSTLRSRLEKLAQELQIDLLIPPLKLCTDNAAMVASCGYFSSRYWKSNAISVNAQANWPIGEDLENFQ